MKRENLNVWKRRLKLGTYFRINVYVHWSFAILVAYAAYIGFGDGPFGSLYSVLLLCGMFFCVTLHEYGHALTARRFGIETVDITLFPIGGVARLVKIPRIPWQELVVAVAGPAVNVVIVMLVAAMLLSIPIFGMPSLLEIFTSNQAIGRVNEALNAPSLLGFCLFLIAVNTVLVLFNLIPAFPMDGGRMLRSLLAMVLEYRMATRIASVVGLFVAGAMFVLAIRFSHPPAGLIALFIGYAGLSESRQVEAIEPLRSIRVRAVMIEPPTSISAETQLTAVRELLKTCSLSAVPVVGDGGLLVGILSIEDVVKAIDEGAGPETQVWQVMRDDVPVLSPEMSLDRVLTDLRGRWRLFPVTSPDGTLIGLLNLDEARIPLKWLNVAAPS